MSWYQKGYTGIAVEQTRIEESQGPQRFYVPPGVQKEFVFIDDEPFCLHEHNPKIGGSFRNWLTCLQGASEDAVCCKILGPSTRYYCGYLTIVDCSKWEDKKGNQHQFEMRLIQAKMPILKKFERKRADKGTLVSCLYKASRDDVKAPSCGDDFEFNREADMDKLFEVACYRGEKLTAMWAEAEQKPEAMVRLARVFDLSDKDGNIILENGKLPRRIPAFNYFKVLQPKSPKDLKLELTAADTSYQSGGGSGRSGGQSVMTDDVPF